MYFLNVFASLRLEKRVGQADLVDVFELRIVGVVFVYIEKDWHVDFFVRVQPLLFEAKALNFVEIEARIVREYCVGCDTDYRSIRQIFRLEYISKIVTFFWMILSNDV